MRILKRIGLGLLAIIGTIAFVGALLPQRHVATLERSYEVTADSLYALVSRPASYPAWRKSVSAVEVTDSVPQLRFREHAGGDVITYDVEEATTPTRFRTRIADPDLPFGGSWTFEIVPSQGTGASLRITEDGEVYNPIFRFISRFVIGHTSTIEGYLDDVQAAVGARAP